jgi:hypothetical protein
MKDVRFIWGLPQEDSFMKLKELITSAPVLVLPNDNLLFRLEADSSGIATRELWKDKGRGTIKSAEWSESDGLLMFHGKIYVPKDRDLRHRIVKQHHDTHVAGHGGCFKTLELVSRNYWWPQMSPTQVQGL